MLGLSLRLKAGFVGARGALNRDYRLTENLFEACT